MVRALIFLVSTTLFLLAQNGLFAAGGGGGGGGSDQAQTKKVSSEFAEAKSLIKKENYPRAIELLNQALAKDDNKADVYNLLGYSHRKSGDLEKGQQYYLKALAIDPNHLGALEYQGELYLMQGDLAKAKENLKRLDRLCFFGCEEYTDLKMAIDKHGR
jgi:tetratricopeptide (TPR) repeat protein